MMSKQLRVPLEQALVKEQVGAKAATLAALLALRHRVPKGFVLPVEACSAVEGSLSAPLRQAIAEGLGELGGAAVAVRSSAVCEDGREASFAGQLSTTLDAVGPAAVEAGVMRCIASARASSVEAYQRAVGERGEVPIAVIVQRMVPPDAAGVAFTVDPSTGDAEITINAVSGLGDKLVSGEVTPETWVFSEHGAPRVSRGEKEVLDEKAARSIADLARQLEA